MGHARVGPVRLVMLVIVAIAMTGGVSRASNRRHIALLDFAGPKAVSVRGDVMRIAATRGWVSSATRLDGRTMREFAEDYELDLVVEGAIVKRGQAFEIRIRFVRGSTGRSIHTMQVATRKPVLDHAAKKRVERELVRALAAIPARQSGGAAQAGR